MTCRTTRRTVHSYWSWLIVLGLIAACEPTSSTDLGTSDNDDSAASPGGDASSGDAGESNDAGSGHNGADAASNAPSDAGDGEVDAGGGDSDANGSGGGTGCETSAASTGGGDEEQVGDNGCEDPVEPDAANDGCEDFVSDQSPWTSFDVFAAEAPMPQDRGHRARFRRDGLPAAFVAANDVTHIEGDIVYALSDVGGLSIVDVADSAHPRVLGSHRTNAKPSRLFFDNGIAYVIFRDPGRPVTGGSRSPWFQASSIVQALDVRDPTQIKVLASRELVGSIVDAHKRGDVIYLMIDQVDSCRDCDAAVTTRLLSLDASEPSPLTTLAELSLTRGPSSTYGGPIAMAVAEQRLYLTGAFTTEVDTTLRVVDLTGARGQLRFGAQLPLRGSVHSAAQLEERDGVLRALTVPTPVTTSAHLQTFRVDGANAISPIATVAVPAPLSSFSAMRLSGTRAYASTVTGATEQLVVFDLTDPNAPRQAGAVAISGWPGLLEMRGHRLYMLGTNDFGAAEHSFLSLFDVSNPDAPQVLDRVEFGKDIYMPVGFELLLDQGLILVPQEGGTSDTTSCEHTHESGIQLIDVAQDRLTLRGIARPRGDARQALLHRDHLIGLSNDAVQVFDIADRSNVRSKGTQVIAAAVVYVRSLGDSLLRFSYDWWTRAHTLDIVETNQASAVTRGYELDLVPWLGAENTSCKANFQPEGTVYRHGDVAYIPYRGTRYDAARRVSWQTLIFLVLDLSVPTAPAIIGKFEVEQCSDDGKLGGIVLTDRALLVAHKYGRYGRDIHTGQHSERSLAYDIFDLSNPRVPRLATTFQVPRALAIGGFGLGPDQTTIDTGERWWRSSGGPGALAAGDLVVSQHDLSVAGAPRRLRYYLDRLDVSDPSAPKLLEPVNIPGPVVRYDAKGDTPRIVTLDYRDRTVPSPSYEDCRAKMGSFDPANATCTMTDRRAHVLDLLSDRARRLHFTKLDSETRVARYVSVSGERIFHTAIPRAFTEAAPLPVTIVSLSSDADGHLQRSPHTVVDYAQADRDFTARGSRAFFVDPSADAFVAVESEGSQAPTIVAHPLREQGIWSIEVAGDTAYGCTPWNGALTFDLR